MFQSIKKYASGGLNEYGNPPEKILGVRELKVEKNGNNSVLIMTEGRIDLSNSHLLKDKLQVLYEEGFNVITLDFSSVSSIDSSGLGKLLLFQKRLKERQGELKIINITSDYIRKMFKMIHLYKVINIEDELMLK